MTRDWKIGIFLSILLIVRIYFFYSSPSPFENGDKIRISTTVRSEPIRYETSQYLRLEGLKIYLPLYPEVSYGDEIVVEGTVDGDKLKKPKLVEIKPAEGAIYKFRNKLLAFYRRSLPEPHSSLIAGVTIGSKSGIPAEFWDKLRNSGTAHVVVASGMNVSLVAGFLINFFILFFKRRKALVLALIGIWLYAVLSGFDAPIVRAAIMGSIAFLAQEMGRLNFAIRALFLSAAVMLFINPSYLTDVGFLLSFFATLGLIVIEPKIRKKLRIVPGMIREDLSTTLSAQIAVTPILYYFFGRVSVLSPIYNVLVLWTIVPVTLIGMIGGLVGLLIEPIGTWILWLSYPLTSWFAFVVKHTG